MIPPGLRSNDPSSYVARPREPLRFYGLHPDDFDRFVADLGDDRLRNGQIPPMAIVQSEETWQWITSPIVQTTLASLSATMTATESGLGAGYAPLKADAKAVLDILVQAGIVRLVMFEGRNSFWLDWKGWRYQLAKTLDWKAYWDLEADALSR